MKEKDPSIRIVGVEPEPGHRLPGLKSFKEASVPGIFDQDVIDQAIVVSDDNAYRTTMAIWRREALMVGPSTGAVVHAATQIDAGPNDVVVAISADSGVKYTSYFEEILGGEGKPGV